MAGPLKLVPLLSDLAYAQNDAEEHYSDIDSEKELEDTFKIHHLLKKMLKI
jgi:hypothetical protein